MPFVSANRPCARCCDVYECSYCPECKYETASTLILHLKKCPKHRRQTNHTIFRCQKCNIDFQSKRGFIHHLQQKRIHKDDLHQAACCGRFQDVARFIQNQNANETGASHIVKSGELTYQLGMTPMHCAAFKGYSRCLRMMLSWEDGNPNMPDELGQTPVHVAVRCGKASSLRLLLSKGGSLDLKDNKGMTPISLATEECMEAIIMHHQIKTMIREQISIFFMKKIEAKRQLSLAGITDTGADDSSCEDGHGFPQAVTDAESLDVPSRNTTLQCCNVDDKSDETKEESNSSSAIVERNSNVMVKKREVSSKLFPFEVYARGEQAINAFKTALAEGTSSASRLKIIVVGDVRAGKTSLTRSLSGQAFVETREKTHGIQTTSISESIVQNTELNAVWKVADCNESHLDALIAQVVSDTLKEMPEIPSRQVPELPPSPGDFKVSQIMKPMDVANASKGVSSPSPSTLGSRVLITEPSIVVEGSPRKLPASLIAKNLLTKNKESVSVKVNIWDFAGHKLYEPMHHLFMNSRSLYLVVFNLCKLLKSPEKCLNSIHYWLNSIVSHTKSTTPVMLVGTHKAKVSPDFIDEAETLCNQHFALTFGPRLVRGFNKEILFAVENSESEEDEGITNLRNVIRNDASMNFSFVNEEFPLQWLHCEEEIIKYRQNPDSKKCLTLSAVKKLLEEKCALKFTDDEFNSMISFFHDTGLILLPGAMCGVEKESSAVNDLVILSPQYLVDIMTSIHDVPKDRNFQRQFSDEFRKLEAKGRIDSHVLEHVWKNKEVKADVLVELLSCFNIFYPLFNGTEEEDRHQAGREYIIPCMLKDKSDEKSGKRWEKACETWIDDSDKESQFVFDFGRFLPLPLFNYLQVHICRHSVKTKGITPILEKRTGIFSFSNKFLFRLRLVLKDCQIWVHYRCKKGEDFLELAQILKEKVHEICQQYFKYLKFVFGPPCPREDCPGATFHADNIQRPCESSSSESDGNSESSDDAESCAPEEVSTTAASVTLGDKTERRCHVIHMNLDSFDPPYWCREVDVSKCLEDWDPTVAVADEDLNQSSLDEEVTDPPDEECVEECCLDMISKKLGMNWKKLGRKLKVQEAKIENISADSFHQEEHGFQVLLAWKKRCGCSANVCKLTDALESLQMNDVADELEKHYLDTHKE